MRILFFCFYQPYTTYSHTHMHSFRPSISIQLRQWKILYTSYRFIVLFDSVFQLFYICFFGFCKTHYSSTIASLSLTCTTPELLQPPLAAGLFSIPLLLPLGALFIRRHRYQCLTLPLHTVIRLSLSYSIQLTLKQDRNDRSERNNKNSCKKQRTKPQLVHGYVFSNRSAW